MRLLVGVHAFGIIAAILFICTEEQSRRVNSEAPPQESVPAVEKTLHTTRESAHLADSPAPIHELKPEPDLIPQVVETRERLKAFDIYFNKGESAIRENERDKLIQIFKLLSSVPDHQVVLIGHASMEGDDAYNLALSERRAKTVRKALIQTGISESRFRETSWVGEARPKATVEQSRRVAVTIRLAGDKKDNIEKGLR